MLLGTVRPRLLLVLLGLLFEGKWNAFTVWDGRRLVAAGPRLLLHGRRKIWRSWAYFCMAVQHFNSLGTVGGRLVAAGPGLLLHGKRNIFGLAGAAL